MQTWGFEPSTLPSIDSRERGQTPIERAECLLMCASSCRDARPLVGRLVSKSRLVHSQLGKTTGGTPRGRVERQTHAAGARS